MINNSCLIYNFGQHYRKGIFKLLDKKLGCHSYFGDKMGSVKKIDYDILIHFKKELKNNILFSPIYWQSGAVSLLFKDYKHFIMLGEYYCLSTWVILILSRFTNKKVYLWTHGWYGNESFIKKFIKKRFFSLADEIFLYGTYAKKLMVKEGFNPHKLKVVYNSLDYFEQIGFRKKARTSSIYMHHFDNNFPTLIFIGRLTIIKKLNLILEALSLLKKSGINLNFVFVGEGDELPNLKKCVNELGLNNNVWFYGASYNEEEICELIYNSEICISPGNVGLTAMHSLVYGTPVITHDDFSNQMPEFEAIEYGKSGLFFKKDNVYDLSEKIKFWLNNKSDRDNIRKECYQRIDHFYNPIYQFSVIESVIKN